ncbi:PRD domain-containing protein [Streptomyces mutabilis]|uniref:PRD domain-containing protein n=1 Tax=Streptomyces mutabilis TaxID=67332 RepID=A0A086MVE3_9ACTN|nr:PRD domain-containing protein [Streptomyces mutabilis]KFG72861.1 hypothetical protein FM21_18500 [Streptomyces mutabilis]
MKIAKIINNNVVLASDDHADVVVLMGRGLGFGVRAGDPVDDARVERTFVPTAWRPPEHIVAFLEQIPAEHLAVAEEIVRLGRRELGEHVDDHVVIPLADHLSFALRRAEEGVEITYPLRGEVLHLYPQEVALSRQAIALVGERLGVRLPDVEAIPLALHFVNAQFQSADMSKVVELTEVFAAVLDEIGTYLGIRLDEDSLQVSRFITHLRYFARRQDGPETSTTAFSSLYSSLCTTHPREVKCAEHIGAVLRERQGWAVGQDEVLYLALHIGRLVAGARTS